MGGEWMSSLLWKLEMENTYKDKKQKGGEWKSNLMYNQKMENT